MSDKQAIKATVRQIVNLLVNGEYKVLESITNGCLLTAHEIAEGISDYGETLIMPPDSAFDDFNLIEQMPDKRKSWYAAVDLWTRESGKSDSTIELTLIDNGKRIYEVEIDNIHVL